MKEYIFIIKYTRNGTQYEKVYNKYCKQYKKTKLYKSLLYLLNNDKIDQIKVQSYKYTFNQV